MSSERAGQSQEFQPRFLPKTLIEGSDKNGPYGMLIQEVQPNHTADTMVILAPGSAKGASPIDSYRYFQERFAKEGFGSVVYHPRGVGKQVDIDGSETSLQRPYEDMSLNDRVDDLVRVLLEIEKSDHAPKRYILSGISMGADAAVRSLQRLREIQFTTDANFRDDDRAIAKRVVQKIAGIMLFAPAAYRSEVLELAAGNPTTDRDIQGTRTNLLYARERTHQQANYPLSEAPIFSVLDQTRQQGFPLGIPLFVAGRTHDKVVGEALPHFLNRLYDNNRQDRVILSGSRHDGIIADPSAQPPEESPSENRETVYRGALAFAKRIERNQYSDYHTPHL